MSERKPRVLILESHSSLVELWRAILGGLVETIFVRQVTDVEWLFETDKSFDLVVVGCTSNEVFDVTCLVGLIRRSFAGPILANSSQEGHTQRLIEVGATHGCFKCAVPVKVREILNL